MHSAARRKAPTPIEATCEEMEDVAHGESMQWVERRSLDSAYLLDVRGPAVRLLRHLWPLGVAAEPIRALTRKEMALERRPWKSTQATEGGD